MPRLGVKLYKNCALNGRKKKEGRRKKEEERRKKKEERRREGENSQFPMPHASSLRFASPHTQLSTI
jgi:hypothetical protein